MTFRQGEYLYDLGTQSSCREGVGYVDLHNGTMKYEAKAKVMKGFKPVKKGDVKHLTTVGSHY